jgi:hypothetical protein
MNDELIFVKTAAGEDAVRDRTRLVQRNLRMVLILVDGLTKVAALKQKAGDPAMIETALAELERIGLIESTATKGARQASAITEAISNAAIRSEPEPALESYEEFPTVDTVFDDLAAAASTATVTANTVEPVVASTPGYVHPAEPSEGWFTRFRKRWHQVREERAFEKAYGTPSGQEAPAKVAPRRHVRRRIRLMPILGIAVVLAILFGVARVVFYPYDEFRPEVEKQLSGILADEVKVAHVRLAFLPLPTFVLEQVSVGRGAEASVEQISIVPNPGIVFGGPPIRSVAVAGIRIKESLIGKTAGWFAPGSMGNYFVEQIDVRNLSLDLGWKKFQGISGAIRPGLGNAFAFQGRASDGNLEFEIVPAGAGWTVKAHSAQWTAPLSPPVKLAGLDLVGSLSPGRFNLTKIDARAFDGLLAGTGVLSWDPAPRLALDVAMKHVAAASLLEELHAPVLLQGEMAGQVQYSSTSPSLHWLGAGAKVSGTFSAAHGNLKRIDLAGALKTSGQRVGPYRGGETGFEDIAGRLVLDDGMVRITDVRLSSGLLTAFGQVAIATDTGQVTGSTSVEMRGSARAPRATMSIGGKAADPELRTGR